MRGGGVGGLNRRFTVHYDLPLRYRFTAEFPEWKNLTILAFENHNLTCTLNLLRNLVNEIGLN